MIALDILYWSCLLLGICYMGAVIAIGGLSHLAGGMQHGHVGDAGGGHVDAGSGHAGHVDAGSGHAGHVDAGAGHSGHVDAGHAPGHGAEHGVDAGHGHHADAGGHHGHDHAVEAEEAGGRSSLLTYLNPMYVTGLLLGFGGGGIASRFLAATPPQSLIWACALGGGLYWGTALLVCRLFGAAQMSSHVMQESLVGAQCKVIAPIDGIHAGTVCYTVKGVRSQMRAVTDENEAIPVGAAVRIRRIEKSTAYVTPVDLLS